MHVNDVLKIRVFSQQEDGSLRLRHEYSSASEQKRKHSRLARAHEKNVRTIYSAVRTFVDEMEGLHDASARKKKDGWVRDYPKNSAKASRKALKKLRKISFF